MKGIEQLVPSQLRRYSELGGGRKLRDFEYFHWKQYDTAGHAKLNFFNVDGKQKDISGAVATVLDVSNMVQAGKMDEPFIITAVSVGFYPLDADTVNCFDDTWAVLVNGKLEVKINDIVVFERTPLCRCGSPLAFKGVMGLKDSTDPPEVYLSNGIRPHRLDPPIFCEEGIKIGAEITWTTVETVNTDSWVGVYLHGGKYFKG